MKELGVLVPPPPGWDASQPQGYPRHFFFGGGVPNGPQYPIYTLDGERTVEKSLLSN